VPWAFQVNAFSLVGDGISESGLPGSKVNQILTLLHHLQIGDASAIPFQKGEFREVTPPPLPFPEASANLEDAGISSGEEAFHAQLRGGVEEPVC